MFDKPRRCYTCGKPVRRGYGFSFKRKVDEDCGDGWFCTKRERVQLCNDCLDMLFLNMASTPPILNFDFKPIRKMVSKP